MTQNGGLTPAERTGSSTTVTITCNECQHRQSVGLSAPATLSDRRPDGVVESVCPTCGEITVTGFRYIDDR
ncbi:hypothetical protein [Halocatena pleomorpha]|uniref:Uncharacterized protein n=1 Tax=Halocatena pleomorpha TaxID=1785090 RepID=A0A3P3RK63_9EURY|nr:hypothetical protein [Halocatena pleomorpha]RRJ33775.1 hypothetical protein EIK79_03025 [Halocatena pleomorpha]